MPQGGFTVTGTLSTLVRHHVYTSVLLYIVTPQPQRVRAWISLVLGVERWARNPNVNFSPTDTTLPPPCLLASHSRKQYNAGQIALEVFPLQHGSGLI